MMPTTWSNSTLHLLLCWNQFRCSGSSRIATSLWEHTNTEGESKAKDSNNPNQHTLRLLKDSYIPLGTHKHTQGKQSNAQQQPRLAETASGVFFLAAVQSAVPQQLPLDTGTHKENKAKHSNTIQQTRNCIACMLCY
jgi:hypothetical protein